MCRVLRLALFGALLAFPLAADQPAKSSQESCDVALSQMSTAQFKSCPLYDPDCENCIPEYNLCTRQYDSIAFVRQKPNYVCVYSCNYTDTCYDSACGQPFPVVTSGTFRVRSEPYEYPWDGCPPADIDFCSTMVVGE
jgi:hypothetical protein